MNYEEVFFKEAVPPKYQHASLENCKLLPESFVGFGKQWALDPISLFLIGGYGTGKTHYVFALIREMFRKNPKPIWPRFYTSANLDSILLKASKSDDGDSYEIEARSKEDLLIIDDIGRETKSDRLRRQYFEIINYRYSNYLPTIVTSNYTLEQLGEIIDGSIASRMQEWETIEFGLVDFRRESPSSIVRVK